MPRKGPRRPLLAARVDECDVQWAKGRAVSDGIAYAEFLRNLVTYARLHMPEHWKPPDLTSPTVADEIGSRATTNGGVSVQPEDMSVGELEVERERLHAERLAMSKHWQVPDEDGEWEQIGKEIDRVDELLAVRRQQ